MNQSVKQSHASKSSKTRLSKKQMVNQLQKSTKTKPIVKMSKTSKSKHIQQTTINAEAQEGDQRRLQQVFSLHESRTITMEQLIFSLKMMGIVFNDEMYKELEHETAQWPHIDYLQFTSIYSKYCTHSNMESELAMIYGLMCKGEEGISLKRLEQLCKMLKIPLEETSLRDIIEYLGNCGIITFKQFRQVMTLANACVV